MPSSRIVVVGAGIGGLVAALELAACGLEVVICESARQPGGKIRQVPAGGSLQNAGPTVFTMKWVFEELFAQVGETMSDHLHLSKLETLARHFWDAGEASTDRLDLLADINASANAIGEFAGAAEARRYRAFCERTRQIYQTLESPYLRAARPSPASLAWAVGRDSMKGLAQISPFGSMWGELGRYFHNPRLRQLFGRYATYCGSSPFHAAATLMLVAHVEQEGVWSLEGGMHALAAKLAQLATKKGASFRYGAQVSEVLIRGAKARGVQLADGDVIDAAAVIFNGDSAALASGLLGAELTRATSAPKAMQRSLSAITWNLVAPVSGPSLSMHNVFFSHDSQSEFDALFAQGKLPADPTVYVCAQDHFEGKLPIRDEPLRLFCLINAPATADQPHALTPADIERAEAATFAKLQRCGLQLGGAARDGLRTTPADFNRLFPATGGALYGQASHGWRSAFERPGARSKIECLYLAGGSAHPGPGVPMAALSGRQAAASVIADLRKAIAHDDSIRQL